MNNGKVLIFGATGAVGAETLQQLKNSTSAKEIFVLTRRHLPSNLKGMKVREYIVDFDHLDENLDCFSVDTVICAIGTTIKKAGSQDEFRKVDYNYPLKIAQLAKARGAQRFLLVSSLGANAESNFFYNRVKGELERDLKRVDFANLVIVRPSVLIGHRTEVRVAERISQEFSKIFPRRWRGVPVKCVAETLVRAMEHPSLGLRIIENDKLFRIPATT